MNEDCVYFSAEQKYDILFNRRGSKLDWLSSSNALLLLFASETNLN